MASTTNKQRLLTQLLAVVPDASVSEAEPLPVLEQLIYGFCRENATREQADKAFRRLREQFFDWNEVRVSSIRELCEAFAGLSQPERRAERLVNFLQEVFETTYSFDLDSLQKKGVKQAAKQLSRYEAANPFAVSWVVQQSLGGHAIPVDSSTLRCAQRLGLIDEEQTDLEAAQATLEHLVPKVRGAQFSDAMSAIALENCFEEEPQCGSCSLSSDCPSAHTQERVSLPVSRSRVKPR